MGPSSGSIMASRKRHVTDLTCGSIPESARTIRSAWSLASSQGQVVALRGGEQQALAAVGRAGAAVDEPGFDQFLEHPVEALLGDAQNVQEFGDRQARLTVDEVQHPVMGAPEAEIGEDPVGIADEVAVGEEEKLDQVVDRRLGQDLVAGGRALPGRLQAGGGSFIGSPTQFMSALLTYLRPIVTRQATSVKRTTASLGRNARIFHGPGRSRNGRKR